MKKHDFPFLLPMAGRLAAVILCLGTLTSCLEKLEQFLPKPPTEPPPAEKPLTPEEEQMQKTLERSDVFTPAAEEEAPVPQAEAFELNKSSIVSILLYHDFVERIPRSEMMVSMPVFRAQMQALKDANIPVIPMSDVLAWKRGEKNIPDESVVISLDDGWKGVYELAYPVLKEFNYPFTLYLYKKYIGGAGRSMTVEQIKEMLANGGELGSHTISHKGLAMTKRGMTEEAYKAWLTDEILESKKWLEATFGVPCPTLAYPFGNKSEEVVKFTMDSGYEAATTVNPQKITWDTPNGELPRFTQIRDQDGNFKLATNFHGGGGNISDSKYIKTDAVDESGQKLIDLKPEPNSTVTDRRPLIEAGLTRLGPIMPETLRLRISGFGAVPLEYDPSTQTVRYRVPQRLRRDDCNATLSFRRQGADKDETVSWQFKIDQAASYLPQGLPPSPDPASTEAAPAPSASPTPPAGKA